MSSDPDVTAAWTDPSYVVRWSAADGLAGLLRLPWRLSTALTSIDGPPRLVMDLGSGPGTFLNEFLTRFPRAQGVWVDASDSMLGRAQELLAPHGDRVDYVVGDIATLRDLDLPDGCDVVTNSRVAHHFDPAGLTDFYRQIRARLRPGGWLVTLDHILPPGDWDARYRRVIKEFAGPNAGEPTHPHYFPYPTPEGHLRSFADAGFVDTDLAWRAMYTCLFLGRAG
jgi:SAM-dependent methyltransferase